ncbi:MAG TPA: NUDIX domain-containing protein [Acholeplasmataceae bacterium]|nr:NUDIX domain-containing protein [Acholeplasmataceae bacterium]
MKIGKIIIEDNLNYKDLKTAKKRKTVRAVILNSKNQVLMLYSKLFDDYTFPGGGIKSDESKSEALKRELLEEIGAYNTKIIKRLGHTIELKYSIGKSNNIYKQKSYYYLCRVDELGPTNFMGREQEQGLEAVFIDVDEAITHNKKTNEVREHSIGMKTVLIRENRVLEKIKGSLK